MEGFVLITLLTLSHSSGCRSGAAETVSAFRPGTRLHRPAGPVGRRTRTGFVFVLQISREEGMWRRRQRLPFTLAFLIR